MKASEASPYDPEVPAGIELGGGFQEVGGVSSLPTLRRSTRSNVVNIQIHTMSLDLRKP